MSCLQHTEGLSKSQMRTDIRSEQHPPVVHISSALRSIRFDLFDGKKCFLADFVLPVLDQVRSAETAGQQLPSRPVIARVKHGEDACLGEVGQPHVPLTLHVLGTDLVNFFKRIEVCDSDLIGGQSNNRAIFLVQAIDVEDPLASDDCALQPKVCETGVPRSWQMSGRARESDIEEL
jgi:hypothetical protein